VRLSSAAAHHAGSPFAPLGETQRFIDDWEKNAPSVLNDAIRSRGLIVPLSRMSLTDVRELLEIYRRLGDRAVTDRLVLHYDQIFGAPDFLNNLSSSWASRQSLRPRLPILTQALRAHELALFAVSIPALIAQFEGIVADLSGHVGKMTFAELKRHVGTLAGASAIGDILGTFVTDALLAQFHHGSLIPPFSRHAILHGGDIAYSTEMNSRTAILLIDQITEPVDGA
jgi:hypothetical protein